MTRRAWVDANVILRFLLRDDERLYARAAEIMAEVEAGRLNLLVSPLTVAEMVWTLESYYELPRERIRDVIASFLQAEGIEAEEAIVLLQSLDDYLSKNVDFIDAYVANHALSKRISTIYTFDKKHFSRLPVTVLD